MEKPIPLKTDLAPIKAQIAQERQAYETQKENFKTLEETLEAEFKASLPTLFTQEERDVLDLDGDPIAQYELLQAKRDIAVTQKVEEARATLEAFEDEIEAKEQQLEDLEAEDTFSTNHPDLDKEGFASWLQGDVAPNIREEIIQASGGDKVVFLGLMAKRFLEERGIDPSASSQNDPNLSTNLLGIAGETGDIDKNATSQDDAFARDAGLFR